MYKFTQTPFCCFLSHLFITDIPSMFFKHSLLNKNVVTGHSETACSEEHAKGSLLPVHRRSFAHVRGYFYWILGIWIFHLNLFTQQRKWSYLDQSSSKYICFPSNSHRFACNCHQSSLLTSKNALFP